MQERKLYLDSSALAKRYVEERGTDTVDSLFGEAERGEAKLCFSIWNVGELSVVLDKYEREGLLEAKSALGIFLGESGRLERNRGIEIIPVSNELITRSLEFVFRHHIYVADALQIASCIASSCTEFVSADKRLLGVAKAEGLTVVAVASQ